MGRPLKIAKSSTIDTGFNNPAGSGSTYGVVGGNTTISGQQILARVAIGVTGTGTIYADTASTVVSGIGTDFTTDLAVGSYVGTTGGTAVGFVSSIGGSVTVTTVGSDATSDAIEVDDTSSLVVEGAIVFAAAIGGLTAGAIYYVESIVDGTHITVASTATGALLPLTTTTVVTTGTQDTITLAAVAGVAVSNGGYVFATSENGYIVRQKGKTKYLVTGLTSGLTGACYTADLADAALTPNTMSITATLADTSTTRLSTVNDYWGVDFTDTGAGNVGVKYVTSFNGAGAAPAGTTHPIVDVSSS
jgi:hypothetical protein